ncbi:MAG: DUF927 domain-containing protein [Alphaproteobacteria bacterium]|nr:DUF927 domain-containing protein [Alphaproteobacteria bacterium]
MSQRKGGSNSGNGNGAAPPDPAKASRARDKLLSAKPVTTIAERRNDNTARSGGDGSVGKDRTPLLNDETHPSVFGFEWHEDGLWRIPADANKTAFRVCSLFEVLALSRPETNDDWGILIRLRDRDKNEHEWIIPLRLLVAEAVEVRAKLAACGLRIGANEGAQRALREYLAAIDEGMPARVRTVPRTGWYRPTAGAPVFVLPGRTIGASAGEVVRLDLDQAPAIYRARGTLEEWKEELARRCIGNTRLVFAVSAAFAGPIIGLTQDQGGGFNFRGETSRGKTSCIDAAASVWGSPSETGPDSFTRNWRSTDNAMESTAMAHNDCILPLDELGQADPATLPETLYMLANGTGKARARASGGNRAGISWRTVVLSTSEDSAARMVEQVNRRMKGGQEVRLIDFGAEVPGRHGVFENLHDAANGGAFWHEVRNAVVSHYGTAGPAFAQWLVETIETSPDFVAQKVAPKVRDWLQSYVKAGSDGQVQRAARRFALMAVAGELATEANITGWPQGEAARAAATVFRTWTDERGGIGSRDDHHLFEAFRAFFVEHGQARFEKVLEAATPEAEAEGMDRERMMMRRVGWRWRQPLNEQEKQVLSEGAAEAAAIAKERGDTNGPKDIGPGLYRWAYALHPHAFQAEVAGPLGIDKRDALRRLGMAGLIEGRKESGEQRWEIKKRRIPGAGYPRVIVPTLQALNER